MAIQVEFPSEFKAFGNQVIDVKRDILKNINSMINSEINQGFPEDHQLLLKDGPTARRRKLNTIDPNFWKIGIAGKPTQFIFIAGEDTKKIIAVINDIVNEFYSIAPVRKGIYERSLKLTISRVSGGRTEILRTTNLIGLNQIKLKSDERIFIYPSVKYAVLLEKKYATEIYKKNKKLMNKGIMFQIARKVQKIYKAEDASIRFRIVRFKTQELIAGIEVAAAGKFNNINHNPRKKIRGRR